MIEKLGKFNQRQFRIATTAVENLSATTFSQTMGAKILNFKVVLGSQVF